MSNQFKKPSISHADPSVKDTAGRAGEGAISTSGATRDGDQDQLLPIIALRGPVRRRFRAAHSGVHHALQLGRHVLPAAEQLVQDRWYFILAADPADHSRSADWHRDQVLWTARGIGGGAGSIR